MLSETETVLFSGRGKKYLKEQYHINIWYIFLNVKGKANARKRKER
jgi:hypothetical protein